MSEHRPSKKELLKSFREQREVGGVYAIKSTVTGKSLVISTTTISKAENQFAFARQTGSCVHPVIARDWETHGAGTFTLEILERMERKDEQSEGEFREDVRALEGLWREKIGQENLYG